MADVTKPDSVRAAVDSVLAKFGRIDVLVNALGDSIRKPLVKLPDKGESQAASDDEVKFVMDINLTEAILCTRAVGAHMLERRSGKVISISSYTASKGGGEMVLYTAAKTALVGFTRAQALEWAPYGVQVNAIAPGIFPDPVTSGEKPRRRPFLSARKAQCRAPPTTTQDSPLSPPPPSAPVQKHNSKGALKKQARVSPVEEERNLVEILQCRDGALQAFAVEHA